MPVKHSRRINNKRTAPKVIRRSNKAGSRIRVIINASGSHGSKHGAWGFPTVVKIMGHPVLRGDTETYPKNRPLAPP